MANKGNSGQDVKTDAPKSLNEQNWPRLLALVAMNIGVFGVLAAIDPTPYIELAKPWKFLLPAGGGFALIALLNGQLRDQDKDRLVFLKWQNPLPGSEAYTFYAMQDRRFSQADVLRIFHPDSATLADPQKQNAHWYNHVFLPVQNRPAVLQAHRNFLFARDFTALSVMMFIVFGAAGYFLITPFAKWGGYCFLLLGQYGLSLRAARTYGVEVVKNAMAQAVGTATNPARDASNHTLAET
jgi:hypothetical protein